MRNRPELVEVDSQITYNCADSQRYPDQDQPSRRIEIWLNISKAS